MFSTCELCDVVVEKIFVAEEGEYACPGCWEAYGEIH
jgi:formamidopyrimidine-DNA glycosylase